MAWFTLGLDIGRPSEFTAVAVVERTDQKEFVVRHLERFVPGTPYHEIGVSVERIIVGGKLGRPTVVMDQTAVGSGVRDLFRKLIPSGTLKPMTITSGVSTLNLQPFHSWDQDTVAKKELVTGLQLALQGRRLKVPASLPLAETLIRELSSFRAKVSLSAAGDSDWREGPHDDLVLATALALWHAERFQPGGVSQITFSGPSETMKMLDEIFPHLIGIPW